MRNVQIITFPWTKYMIAACQRLTMHSQLWMRTITAKDDISDHFSSLQKHCSVPKDANYHVVLVNYYKISDNG